MKYAPLDQETIEHARRGDRESFGRLAEEMRPRLLTYAYRLTHDRTAAQEAVQDAFTKALADVHSRPEGLQFSAWLYTITRNIVIDKGRQAKTRPTYSMEQRAAALGWDDESPLLHAGHLASGSEDAARDPADIVGERDEHEALAGRLHATLAGLSKFHRHLLLGSAAKKTYAEMADDLGVSLQEVKSGLEAARKAARSALRQSPRS